MLLHNDGRWTGPPAAPLSLKHAIDLVGSVTIGVLALTEHFEQLPGALVAVAAGHLIGALAEDPR